jgi:phytoene dehydrogenase-like protein
MRCAVVGAGITGMAAALGLARRGVDVDVIDACDEPGGVARAVRLCGQRFCPGPQYLWGFDDDGAATRILNDLGLLLPTLAMSPSFERVRFGAGPWHGAASVFDDPPASDGDRRFLQELEVLGRAGACIEDGAAFRLDGAAMIAAIARLGSPIEVTAAVRARHLSLADLAHRCGASAATLRRVAFSQGIFAERLDELSAVLFASALRHLRTPLRVPVGGTVALLDLLVAATRARCAVSTGEKVTDVRRSAGGYRLSTSRRELDVDQVVFCVSPAALPPSVGKPAQAKFQGSNTMGVVAVAIETDARDRAALHQKNFTRFADNVDGVDVDFGRAAERPALMAWTASTLNGVVDPVTAPHTQVVTAFFPLGRDDDPAKVDAADAWLQASLAEVLGHEVRVLGRLPLPPSSWNAHFGASDGAIYGRRLTASSLRRSLVGGLPAGVHLAHSAVGIPGVVGCLQMAEAAVGAVVDGGAP